MALRPVIRYKAMSNTDETQTTNECTLEKIPSGEKNEVSSLETDFFCKVCV